jgi:hypothetical protein
MLCTVLHPKGDTRNSFLPAGTTGIPSAAVVGTLLRRATAPDYIGSWPYEAAVVHLYGYKNGKAGTENKHELPPPHDALLLFGEAVVVATTGGVPSRFNGDDYKKFYTAAMGGFEDLDESEEEDSDEEEEEEETEEVDAAEGAEAAETADAEADAVDDVEEEEEDEPAVVKRKPAKPKKASKKLPAFYSLPELEPEAYTYVTAKATAANTVAEPV